MPEKTIKFGFFPLDFSLQFGPLSIATLADLESKISGVIGGPGVHRNWVYAPQQEHVDMMTGAVETLPCTARVFGLPMTHSLTHTSASSEEHLAFLVWCIGFFTGLRLVSFEAGFLDAAPVKLGQLTDFCPLSGQQLGEAIELSNQFWNQFNSAKRVITRLTGVMHALYLAKIPRALDFEKFSYLYAALDACFALTKDIVQKPQKPLSHANRIDWMCDLFNIKTPSWAKPGNADAIAPIRNNAFHEALFFGEPLGFRVYGSDDPAQHDHNVLLQMEALACRLCVALLGSPTSAYVSSPVDTRQIHGLAILTASPTKTSS